MRRRPDLPFIHEHALVLYKPYADCSLLRATLGIGYAAEAASLKFYSGPPLLISPPHYIDKGQEWTLE